MDVIGLFVACLLIPLTKQQCANCPITFACTDWDEFVDGVMTWSTGTDANGCATLTISCGEEPGVTPAVSSKYFYAGSYLIDEDAMPITCNADGTWLPEADSQAFTCAGCTHNDDDVAYDYDHGTNDDNNRSTHNYDDCSIHNDHYDYGSDYNYYRANNDDYGPDYDYYPANNDNDACTDHIYHHADDNNYAYYVYNAANDKRYITHDDHYPDDHNTDHNHDHYNGEAEHFYNGRHDYNCPTDDHSCTNNKHNQTGYNHDSSVYHDNEAHYNNACRDDSTDNHHASAYDNATTYHDCDSLLRAVVRLVNNEALHG